MFGNTLLILPLGLLPIAIIIIILLYFKTDDFFGKYIGSRFRNGITEYPAVFSPLQCATNNTTISFDEDLILLEMDKPKYEKVESSSDAHIYICGLIREAENDYEQRKQLKFTIKEYIDYGDSFSLLIDIPYEMVASKDNVELEIMNLGRVVKVNDLNNVKWLLGSQGGRTVQHIGNRTVFSIGRQQSIPTFFDTKLVTMSEKQITNNLRNRFLNKLEVKCTALDKEFYHGDIIRS